MIRRGEFKRIEIEVQNAIYEAFEYAKIKEKNTNDYILFLSNAHFMDSLVVTGTNPYTIDYRLDNLNDEVRLSNLMEYLNHNYSFQAENTVDSKFSLSLELMIYTHMWESKPYLKILKKLSDLCDSQDYNWNVSVPDMGKHTFIRDDIRNIFKNHNLNIHEIITKGFHTSLRNAFAHSEYVLGWNDPKINLLNYGGASWELQDITFDDWTKRFCYTFLLGYKIQEKFHEEKQKLTDGEPGYRVLLKDKDGNNVNGKLLYDKERNSFRGKIMAPT
jgi:hypothetical protein